jgi:hypothetical protein
VVVAELDAYLERCRIVSGNYGPELVVPYKGHNGPAEVRHGPARHGRDRPVVSDARLAQEVEIDEGTVERWWSTGVTNSYLPAYGRFETQPATGASTTSTLPCCCPGGADAG